MKSFLFTILLLSHLFPHSYCSNTQDCKILDTEQHTEPATMSNAEKFLAAAAEFPEDALDDSKKVYEHPLVKRYATKEMSFVWSPAKKFTTWRKLWTALATAEQELGVEINDEQLEQMRENLYNIDFELAEKKEREFRHDVMGHVHAFGDIAPKAMPITSTTGWIRPCTTSI